jgi:hypothetical protein
MAIKSLSKLATELFEAKRAEDKAKAVRIECEEAIAKQVKTKDNGSSTIECGDGFKLTVKRGIIYTANVDAIRTELSALEIPLPLTFVPATAPGYAFDEKAYEALRDSNPDLFSKVAKYVETKPRKVAVTLALK